MTLNEFNTDVEISDEIYTVSQLNAEARAIIDKSFPLVWVEGEISNFSAPASGHWYFSLKDSQAQIRCAMFRNRSRRLPFRPEHGMQVMVCAKPSLYEQRGDFQLIVEHMEEAGAGLLQRQFEALKKKLQEEGLFAEQHKQALPGMPSCIGVITSATGAAVRDVITVLKRRFASIPVIIYPTQVQGDAAAAQIVQAINTANQRQECDVLLLTRGGGSLEDMWCFNDEDVARAIFASQLPIVSAIGHEIDFSIADFVADIRAATPSAGAELLSPDGRDLLLQLTNQAGKLTHFIRSELKALSDQVMHLSKRIRHPGVKLRQQAQHCDYLEQQLINAIKRQLQHRQLQLTSISRSLDMVSPLSTLARGYSIVTQGDQVIRDADQVKVGEKVTARLHKGELTCRVEKN